MQLQKSALAFSCYTVVRFGQKTFHCYENTPLCFSATIEVSTPHLSPHKTNIFMNVCDGSCVEVTKTSITRCGSTMTVWWRGVLCLIPKLKSSSWICSKEHTREHCTMKELLFLAHTLVKRSKRQECMNMAFSMSCFQHVVLSACHAFNMLFFQHVVLSACPAFRMPYFLHDILSVL